MTDPVTLTAGAIATLAFQKVMEAGGAELGKKFAASAYDLMDKLRQKLWERWRGNPQRATMLKQAENGDRAAVETIGKYLDIEMLESPEFADEVKAIAHEITLLEIEDNSSMNQVNYGGTNYQTKTGPNNTNFFGGSHQH